MSARRWRAGWSPGEGAPRRVNSITAEHPARECSCIDLDPADTPAAAAATLATALTAGDGETLVAVRAGRRLVARLRPLASDAPGGATPTRLVAADPGALD